MAGTLSGVNVQCSVSGLVTFTNGSLVTVNVASAPVNLTAPGPFSIGSAAGQINGAFRGDLVTSGTISTINLSTLLDNEGNSLGFLHIGSVMIVNPATGTATLTVTPAGSNGVVWGQLPAAGIVITPGSPCLIIDATSSMPVSGTSAVGIQVQTSGNINSYPFPIQIMGRNA